MPMALSMAEFPSHPTSFDFGPNGYPEKVEQGRRLRNLLSPSKWRKSGGQIFPSPKQTQQTLSQTPLRPAAAARFPRKGFVGLPRSTTFRRQEDEQRKNLTPVEIGLKERRDPSGARQRALSAAPPPPRSKYRDGSLPPDLRDAYRSVEDQINSTTFQQLPEAQIEQIPPPPPPPPQPPPQDPTSQHEEPPRSEVSFDDAIDEELMEELKKRWILNLSMHFRDKSPREKFFITYAETPDRWRRVTVSCDYRAAPADSLESDLQNLHYPKDKSARIYESIRMSLPDIQFYDTVTNLKLETKDDRLHVHVTEDVNEIIQYPDVHLVRHLENVVQYKESDLHFDEHMSGFVYKVIVGGNTWIKKEIPGPDSVDEFLYEVNALSDLVDSKNVIQLKGLVIDNDGKTIKGLLLDYAERGALVDVIYDSKEGHLPQVPWSTRERWAKQIIQGLSNIHEAGFVQGDFTLSNIVINDKDEAQVIDINRRGCPVGWESPEMEPLVESGQRLSMYIGIKSDLYQLGMVLWALAMEEDEPERAKRPLSLQAAGDDVPQYFRVLTNICLSLKPKQRFAAKDLLAMFHDPALFSELQGQDACIRSEDASPALDLPNGNSLSRSEDSGFARESFQARQRRYHEINEQITELKRDVRPNGYKLSPKASDTGIEEGFRGRRYTLRSESLGLPPDATPFMPSSRQDPQGIEGLRQLSFADRSVQLSPGRSEDDDDAQVVPISPSGDREWEEINMDGNPYLIHRNTLDDFDDIDNIENARRGKGVERWRHAIGEIEHVDSGLGDMDLDAAESKSRHLTDLAGVGAHTDMDLIEEKGGSIIGKSHPQGITDDLGVGDDELDGKGVP